MPWLPLGAVMAFSDMTQKEREMESNEGLPGMVAPWDSLANQYSAAYAQLRGEQQPEPADGPRPAEQTGCMALAHQARNEVMMRAEHQKQREAEYLASLVMPRTMQGVAPKPPLGKPVTDEKQIGKPKANVAKELMDAMDYLIADVAANVRRNPSMEAIQRNYADAPRQRCPGPPRAAPTKGSDAADDRRAGAGGARIRAAPH